MGEENKVPAIRFKGFSGEWEEKRIQDLIDTQAIIGHLDGNHGELYPRSNEFSDDGIPYIGANDFSNGFVNFTRCKHLPITRAKQFKKGIAKNGDVLFAHNATVGPVAKLETDLDFVILSTTATYFRCDNDTLINDYLLQVLSETKFIRQYSRVMSQSTRNQVPITIQRTFFISIPPKPKEQTKIGEYFQQLDTLITQHQQKHDKLLNLKKSLLEKIFPKQGSTEPAIRFKGFSGAWEEKQLESLTKINQGLQIAISERYLKKIKNSFFYITNEFLKAESDTKYYILNPPESVLCTADDILMTRTGNTGEVVTNVEGAFHNNFFKIKYNKNKLEKNFFVFFLKLSTTNKKILELAGSSTIPDLNHDAFYSLGISYPHHIQEQTKIGNLFKKLDTLLKQHQAQLKKLNNIKQACLAKMFV